MYFIYSIALALVLVLSSPFWAWRALRHGKYRAGFGERFGKVPARLRTTRSDENCIWIHAVSVGEVMAVSALVSALKQKLGPGWRVVLSTTTLTGQTLARQRFGEENVFYLPMDLRFALQPFFDVVRPRLLVLAETEFWPNMLQLAAERKAKIAVVNARISDRSFPRYKTFRGWMADPLSKIDLFLAQSETDRERLVAIGAELQKTQVGGNLKFEVGATGTAEIVGKLRAAISADAPVLVAGSTVEGEEELLLPAFGRMIKEHPQAVIILAPRHPERFPEVGKLFQASQLAFVKRSEWTGGPLSGCVLLLDTIGELASVYELATAAFVGGSLVPRGGHNILEPARFGKPIFVGPYTENFRDIIAIFQRADAVQVLSKENLEDELASTFDAKWLPMGARAREVFLANSGAMQRTLDALEVLLWMPSSIKERYKKAGE